MSALPIHKNVSCPYTDSFIPPISVSSTDLVTHAVIQASQSVLNEVASSSLAMRQTGADRIVVSRLRRLVAQLRLDLSESSFNDAITDLKELVDTSPMSPPSLGYLLEISELLVDIGNPDICL